jgi:hypothetical protein
MKKCLICGHVEDDKSPTCPKCGEATWEAMSEPFAPAPSSDTLPEDLTEAPEVPKKRGRK